MLNSGTTGNYTHMCELSTLEIMMCVNSVPRETTKMVGPSNWLKHIMYTKGCSSPLMSRGIAVTLSHKA